MMDMITKQSKVIEDIFSDSLTRQSTSLRCTGTKGRQALMAEESTGDVPCAQITPNDPGDNIASFGAENKSSTSEPTGADNNYSPSTEHEEPELPGEEVAKTRCERTIERYHESRGDVGAQEESRIRLVRTKYDDDLAVWKKAEKNGIDGGI